MNLREETVYLFNILFYARCTGIRYISLNMDENQTVPIEVLKFMEVSACEACWQKDCIVKPIFRKYLKVVLDGKASGSKYGY